ncbi:MAG: ComF family protein [Flavobacteriaceae bacterium]
MVRLNTHQRAAQIKNVFSVVDSSVFAGKHLLPVDDVVTTGITLSEAANCL